MTKKVNFVAIAAAALLIGVPFLLSTEAQEGKVAPTAAAAVEAPAPLDFDLVDPAFDRYVDILLIGQAWDTLDPVLLTDCAMQLAEGERILMRSHKAVSSKQLLELAAKVAADKRDTATLDRLANVCGATKNTATLEQVAAARKLAGSSRKVDPAMSVSATETTPDQLALYQEAINGAKAAGILGDATYFDNLEEGLADKESVLVTLSETQRSHLKKIMGDARGSMPKESNAQLTDTLAKLKDASRQNIGHGIGSIIHGIRDLQNGHHTGHGIGSIIHGISDLAGHGGHGRGGHGHGYRPYNPYNPYNPYRPYNPYNPYRPYNPYNPYRPYYPGHNHGWRP
ncbi:hypothetical protein ETAA8_34050 [Anatilimnocola aggregata]|uniref:DUF5667 domain-containing protein n=1 Tax=Anatilimnocola aggregata TaxID=2528021 RepID=A0A517YDI8_9BACT|nr:hypothetical protein [Anatilimnocola aggregata]QDU28305.1 hypothetical protein ETAA8_34050 [Anatilimnocola aggregata]